MLGQSNATSNLIELETLRSVATTGKRARIGTIDKMQRLQQINMQADLEGAPNTSRLSEMRDESNSVQGGEVAPLRSERNIPRPSSHGSSFNPFEPITFRAPQLA
jgi:hypothetical protein